MCICSESFIVTEQPRGHATIGYLQIHFEENVQL